MKFLIAINHSYMLWQMRRELIERLLQYGEVVISTPFVGHEEDFEAMGCRCVEASFDRHGTDPMQELALLSYYRKLIAREKPDLVITYSIKPNIYAGSVCRLHRIPYCANVTGLGSAFRNEHIAGAVTVMYRTALRGAKAVFFENESNARIFAERNIIPAERQIRVPGAGVNLQQYAPRPYPGEDHGIHFLYLGRIMRDKGIHEFLDAAERIKQEYGDKAFFDMAGFFDGEDCKERVSALEESGVIAFHGFQTDPKPYYAACHCVVLPSYHEGMSNVLLEAAACGRPLITTNIPGCREAVDEGTTGFLAKPEDSDSLYEAMKRFLALDTAQREKMGIEGRKKMEREFDRGAVIDMTLRALGLEKD